MNSMLLTWQPYIFLIIIFLLILIFCLCRVTLVGAIGRHITIFDFKRLIAYIISLDTEVLYCAEKFIAAYLVHFLLIAHY